MAILRDSSKLATEQPQFCVASHGTVFFRVLEVPGGYKLMTATADEDDVSLVRYPDHWRLINATRTFLQDREQNWAEKHDFVGRPYVETVTPLSDDEVRHMGNTVLMSIGVSDMEIMALKEAIGLYHEFQGPEWEDSAYLMDGVRVTKDGRFV